MLKALSLVVLGLLALGGLALGTQTVAAALHYTAGLGPPWGTFRGYPLYVPWAWIAWSTRFEHAAPDASLLATGAAVLGVAAVATASALTRRAPKASTAHGSSRWATAAEMKRAGMLRDAGVVLCQTKDARFATRVDERLQQRNLSAGWRLFLERRNQVYAELLRRVVVIAPKLGTTLKNSRDQCSSALSIVWKAMGEPLCQLGLCFRKLAQFSKYSFTVHVRREPTKKNVVSKDVRFELDEAIVCTALNKSPPSNEGLKPCSYLYGRAEAAAVADDVDGGVILPVYSTN